MRSRITEDAFLDERIGKSVAIYLINGIKLLGSLRDYDAEVVFLRPHDAPDGGTEMISKAAISTIVSTSSMSDDRDSSDPLKDILSRARAPLLF
jgi:RNA chaperone Hfq